MKKGFIKIITSLILGVVCSNFIGCGSINDTTDTTSSDNTTNDVLSSEVKEQEVEEVVLQTNLEEIETFELTLEKNYTKASNLGGFFFSGTLKEEEKGTLISELQTDTNTLLSQCPIEVKEEVNEYIEVQNSLISMIQTTEKCDGNEFLPIWENITNTKRAIVNKFDALIDTSKIIE